MVCCFSLGVFTYTTDQYACIMLDFAGNRSKVQPYCNSALFNLTGAPM